MHEVIDHGSPVPVATVRPLDTRRLAVSGILLTLLALRGPLYRYAGSDADLAAISQIYGPPDGGPIAYGPALYALPAGWILLTACSLLAVSAMPRAPQRLTSIPVGRLCLLTGVAMLVATALTPVESLMQAYLGVDGMFHLELGKGLYEFYACLVVLTGGIASLLQRGGASIGGTLPNSPSTVEGDSDGHART